MLRDVYIYKIAPPFTLHRLVREVATHLAPPFNSARAVSASAPTPVWFASRSMSESTDILERAEGSRSGKRMGTKRRREFETALCRYT